MIILDGNVTAEKIRDKIQGIVFQETSKGKRPPCLAAILVGNDAASEAYVSHKVKDCFIVGYTSRLIRMDADVTEAELLIEIQKLNADAEVDGIIVQLPLSKQIREEMVIEQIVPQKDVDGFHPQNLGRMVRNLPAHLPATPYGIITLLKSYEISTRGKHVVVIGRSHIVGSPISILMARNSDSGNATVTLCHSHTVDLESYVKAADILIVAAGKKHLIESHMLKPGSVVIDVGIHRLEDSTRKCGYRLTGDVNPEGIENVVSAFTPVPGGVGPMTRAMLLQNTLNAWMETHGS